MSYTSTNVQFSTDLFLFSKGIFNEKLYFLCSEKSTNFISRTTGNNYLTNIFLRMMSKSKIILTILIMSISPVGFKILKAILVEPDFVTSLPA